MRKAGASKMSEALSRRVAASKAEVQKLRKEYEQLLEAGVKGSMPEDEARTEEAVARTTGRREESAERHEEGETSPTKKKRTYNVSEVREYMRKKQREKQLEHVQRQLQKTESEVDAKKRRLRELQEKSRNIVAKNTRNRSRSRSRDSRRDDVKLSPIVPPEPNGGSWTARVATPDVVHPVAALPVVQDVQEEDATRRNRAAIVIQANFKGYKARSSYRLRLQTRKRELERGRKRPKSEWLETDPQSYPYNFISVVKRKLNLAIQTPVAAARSTEDVAVQITPQMSVRELKEKIEASIRKTESRKVDEKIEPEGETSKPKSLRSFLYDLDLKKVESMRLRSKGSDSDTSKNVPDLTSESVEYEESFECGRSDKEEALFKKPEVVLSLKSDTFQVTSEKSCEKVLSSESVNLRSNINTVSRERSSQSSKERSASSQSKKSSEKVLSSESVDVQSDITTVSRERLSRSFKEKSSSSQSKKSSGKLDAAACESDSVHSNISQRSSRSSKERSEVSKSKVPREVSKKTEIIVTSESGEFHSDNNTANRKASSRSSAASLKSESDGFHSDINQKISSRSSGAESDGFRLKIDTDRVRNLRLLRRKDRRDSHDNTLDYYRDGAASSAGSFRTLPSAAAAASSVSEEEELPVSHEALESRRNSIIVGMKCAHSWSAENSLEKVERNSQADDDLASFRRYMRDFDESKKIRHPSSDGGASIDSNSKSHYKYSSNFSSEGLVAPAVSLQRNGGVSDNSEKKANIREVVLKAGEKKCVETTGNSNQIHVKFEAELKLLNDFNDSLRQYMNVEKSLLKLHNKTTSFETRDTQTSLITKSASTSLLISKAAATNSNPIRASRSDQNVADSVARSINTSRGDNFDTSKNVRTVTEDDAPDLQTDEGSAVSLMPSLNYTRGSETVGSYLSMDPSAVMRLSDIMEVSCNETFEETAQASHMLFGKEKPRNVYAGLSLGMFEQLIKDEDARIENLKTILKIREKALLDRTKGELAWLEIQKKNLLETGKLHEASLVKKKQRGIIIKLQHEKHEMQKLKQLQKAASKERKTILREQRDMIKAQLSTTDGAVAKIKRKSERRTSTTGPINVYNYRRETIVSETSYSRRSSVVDEVAACDSVSDGVIGRKEEAIEVSSRTTEAARRSLLMREAALQKRREAVEELLQWHQRLRDDERKIADLEVAASNLISRGPMASFNGAQLNVLWEKMAGRPDKKFADDETYELSRSALDRFCVEAGAAKKTSLDEIAHNISSITDKISTLYKLSSAGQNSNVPSASTNKTSNTLSYGFVNSRRTNKVDATDNEKLSFAEELIGPLSEKVAKQDVDNRSSGISEDIGRKKSASYRSSKSSIASDIPDSSDSHMSLEQSQQESVVVSGSLKKSLVSEKLSEKLQTSMVEDIKSQGEDGSVTTQISELTNKSAMKESRQDLSVTSFEKSTIHETISVKRDDPAFAYILDEPKTRPGKQIDASGDSISSLAGVQSLKSSQSSLLIKESLPEAASVETSKLSSPNKTEISANSNVILDEPDMSVAEVQENVELSVASFKKSRPKIDSPTSSIKTPSNKSDNSDSPVLSCIDTFDASVKLSKSSVLSEKVSVDTSSFKSNDISDKQHTPSPELDISPKSDVISEEQETLSQKLDITPKSDLVSEEQETSSSKSDVSPKSNVVSEKQETPSPKLDISPKSDVISEEHETPSLKSDISPKNDVVSEEQETPSQKSDICSKSDVIPEEHKTMSPKLDISPKNDVVSEEQEIPSQKSAAEVSKSVESSLASFENSKLSVVSEKDSPKSFVQSIKSASQIMDNSNTTSIQDGKLSVISKEESTDISAEVKSVVEDTENVDSSSYKSEAEQSSVLPEIASSNSGLPPSIEVPDLYVKLSEGYITSEKMSLDHSTESVSKLSFPLNKSGLQELESHAKDCSKGDFIESSSVKSFVESYQNSADQERSTPGASAELSVKSNESNQQEPSEISSVKSEKHLDVQENEFLESGPVQVNAFVQQMDVSLQKSNKSDDNSSQKSGKSISAESSVKSNESNQQESFEISAVKSEQHLAVQKKEFSESFPVQIDAFAEQMDVSIQKSNKSDDNSSRKSGKSMSSNRASVESNIEPNSQVSSAKPSLNILQEKAFQKPVSSIYPDDNISIELISSSDGGGEIDKEVATPPIGVALDKDAKNSRNSSVKRKSEEAEAASDENTSSEVTDLISDEPAPVIEVIVEGKRDVRSRVSQILADANLGGTVSSPRVQDLYVTTYDLISPDGSPESRSPTDENDTSTKDIFGNEAEELLRKQLAIEQEIKQLEQQQKEQLPYLYMREIPNKPPPPYTPPTHAPSTIPSTVLPLTVDQIGSMLMDVTDLLFIAQSHNTLSTVVLPENLEIPGVDRSCLEFVFDLCKEATVEHYSQFEETSDPLWMKPQNKVGLKRKFNRAELERHLDRRLRCLFGFEKHDVKESMIIKWSRKRRDHVDELLVVESQAEEAEWTNYDQDERVVKNEAAKELLNMLLGETIDIFKQIVAKKKLKNLC